MSQKFSERFSAINRKALRYWSPEIAIKLNLSSKRTKINLKKRQHIKLSQVFSNYRDILGKHDNYQKPICMKLILWNNRLRIVRWMNVRSYNRQGNNLVEEIISGITTNRLTRKLVSFILQKFERPDLFFIWYSMCFESLENDGRQCLII